MQRITARISVAMLIAGTGFSQTIISARGQAQGSDVVLESAVKEVKSIPVDTANVVGDTVQFATDETVNAAQGVIRAFSGATPHEKTKHDAELAIENAWDSSNDILFRSYKVNTEIGDLLLSGSSTDAVSSIDVSAFFDGVSFPKDTSAYYMPKMNSLLVYQTMENILAIENTLASYQDARRELLGHQVEIETKFVEVSQKTLNELGFSWKFSSDDGGPLNVFDNLNFPVGQDILAGGLRTSAAALNGGAVEGGLAISKTVGTFQWDLFIKALEQADDTDMLSAPRVVALDGSTAIIHVGETRMMPRSFEVDSTDVSPFIQHSDWENEQLGVYMEVTPEIREEGLIDLELKPKVVDLLGYTSYNVMPSYSLFLVNNVFYNGNQFNGLPIGYPSLTPTIENSTDASMPYYRVREMETKVTVADGSTVGMGGLIYDKLETFRDKVPVLGSIPFIGRLFRSEGEKSIKRNLMIFVTATQVDVDGRRSADVVLNK